MEMNGSDVLVLVNTGTDIEPEWTPVGGQRNATVDESVDVIDISSKEQRARRILPGRYSSTLSLDALYVPDNEGYLLLKQAMKNGDPIVVMLKRVNQNFRSATGYITGLSSDYPDQGEATVSITIDIDGEWTDVV